MSVKWFIHKFGLFRLRILFCRIPRSLKGVFKCRFSIHGVTIVAFMGNILGWNKCLVPFVANWKVSTGDCMHLLRTQESHQDPESGTRMRTMSEWSSTAWKYYQFYNISRHRRHFNSVSLQRARNHSFQKTTVKLIFLVTGAKIYLPAKCCSSNISPSWHRD